MTRQKRAQRLGRNALQQQRVERLGQRRIVLQRHQLAGKPRHVGMFDQIVAQLAGFHRRGGRQHAVQIAMLLDQLGGGLRPHPRHARHIIHRIAHQREHIAQFVGADAEFLDHRVRPQPPVVHRVEHVEPGCDQLHQILVT